MSTGAAKIRLAVAAALFLGWIGWLGYLVAKKRIPEVEVLRRPQFVVADLWVIGQLDGPANRPDAKVVVRQVLWAKDKKDQGLAGKAVSLPDLGLVGMDLGWSGPGEYLLALQKNQDVKKPGYSLTPVPSSPGFEPAFQLESAGKNKDEIADEITRIAGLSPKEAREKVETAPSVLKVPREKRRDLQEKLKELGATLELHKETRIYRATPEVLEQLKELPTK
jgi:Ribosomal protein L7/L12 C-terminal domain